MSKNITLLTAALCLVLSPLAASAASKGKTMQEIIDASTAADWRTPNPEDLLIMDIAGGRVVIELAPMFAPEHVANIRTLAKQGYWNGLSIIRSQDNFVVQWGDPAEDPKLAKPLGTAKEKLPAEFAVDRFDKKSFHAIADTDGWSKRAGFVQGFPAATDGKQTWLAHCYAAVGAGRGNEARLQQRHRTVCGDRPIAAPARPQHHHRRARAAGHGIPVHPAARHRPARLL